MPKLKYPKGPTVKELIEHLKQFPDDLIVGYEGHFGEVSTLDLSDIYHRRNESGYPYIVPEGHLWRSNKRKPIDLLKLPTKDFGPDPD